MYVSPAAAVNSCVTSTRVSWKLLSTIDPAPDGETSHSNSTNCWLNVLSTKHVKNSVGVVVGAGNLSWQTVLLYHMLAFPGSCNTSYPGWLTSLRIKSGVCASGDTRIK